MHVHVSDVSSLVPLYMISSNGDHVIQYQHTLWSPHDAVCDLLVIGINQICSPSLH